MQRIALLHLVLGFLMIIISALCGVFLVYWTTEAFVLGAHNSMETWTRTLLKSAHGHTNLFGMIHILYGLTLHHSKASLAVIKRQTLGLCAGSLAMSVVLAIKAFEEPSLDINGMNIVLCLLLTGFFMALMSHVWMLALRLVR